MGDRTNYLFPSRLFVFTSVGSSGSSSSIRAKLLWRKLWQTMMATTTTKKKEEAEGESVGFGSVVASHYNRLEEKGLEQRKESRIFHMRNLNNWIKSQLINEYVSKVRERKGPGGRIRVLDMG